MRRDTCGRTILCEKCAVEELGGKPAECKYCKSGECQKGNKISASDAKRLHRLYNAR